jgi:hypothetical protein
METLKNILVARQIYATYSIQFLTYCAIVPFKNDKATVLR